MSTTPVKTTSTLWVGAAALFLCITLTTAHAQAHDDHSETGDVHFVPKTRPAPTTPSTRYSGSTPIDESNGIILNSGTYGLPNPEYQAWATSATWAVGLADREYSFAQKDQYLATLDERLRFYEAAVWNYKRVTDVSTPEGKAHAEKAAAELGPRIEKAREAWSKAKSANRGNWDAEQNLAKRAFIELQSAYYGGHKNAR